MIFDGRIKGLPGRANRQLIRGCFLRRHYGGNPDPLCLVTALKDGTPPLHPS